ncbi:MAG: hypothetical protein WCO33_04560 [bacterium]
METQTPSDASVGKTPNIISQDTAVIISNEVPTPNANKGFPSYFSEIKRTIRLFSRTEVNKKKFQDALSLIAKSWEETIPGTSPTELELLSERLFKAKEYLQSIPIKEDDNGRQYCNLYALSILLRQYISVEATVRRNRFENLLATKLIQRHVKQI